ncbi:hypothetical protein CEXT_244661 [Caerostris extrusa]|uniref:Uncharacterized protein n=1 Tax=Caerostris extrusa TaxID=172846 RepID=A0AAV4NNF1_CAEEX|nr:hypothetical protein CEXT_244661 [Caerostris extrusa]
MHQGRSGYCLSKYLLTAHVLITPQPFRFAWYPYRDLQRQEHGSQVLGEKIASDRADPYQVELVTCALLEAEASRLKWVSTDWTA